MKIMISSIESRHRSGDSPECQPTRRNPHLCPRLSKMINQNREKIARKSRENQEEIARKSRENQEKRRRKSRGNQGMSTNIDEINRNQWEIAPERP